MLISWIKQFIRVSVKGGFYSVVNTLGLAIGLGCTIIILLWIDFNTSFDKFHSDYRRIYQVYEIQSYSLHVYPHFVHLKKRVSDSSADLSCLSHQAAVLFPHSGHFAFVVGRPEVCSPSSTTTS